MRSGDLHAARRRASQCGFTYLWVMGAIVLISISLAAAGTAWSEQRRRDREIELLRVGALYAQALASYRAMSPGSVPQWPERLDDLLLDPRYLGTVRHLRRLYPDPLNPDRPWGVSTDAQGRVIGVYSQSVARPLRQTPIRLGQISLPAASQYAQWVFSPEAGR